MANDFIRQILPNPDDGTIYDIAAKAANITSVADSLAYYSDAEGTFANSSKIKILDNVNTIILSTTTENIYRTEQGTINGLFITGPMYGNTATYLNSATKGVFSFGDPGPQLWFGTTTGNAGALIYTNQNGNTGAASNFYFVSNETPVAVISDKFLASDFIINNSNNTLVGHLYSLTLGSASTTGEIRFVLGNSIAEELDNNAQGKFFLYGTGTRYARITYDGLTYHTNWHIPSYGTSANEDIYFAHIGGTSAVGSLTLPTYVAENGRITAITKISTSLIDTATTTSNGLMSSSDKIKINKINDTLTASLAIVTDSSGNIVAKNLTVSSPSASGTATSFITTISQDSLGKISATKANLPTATSSINGIGRVAGNDGIDVSYSSGVATVKHSNSITANNLYSSSATTLSANGGKLVVRDFKYDALGHITDVLDREITLSQVDNNTDTKVNVKTRGTTKAYLLATTTLPTSSNNAIESVAETGVYLDTTVGKLVANSFSGDTINVNNIVFDGNTKYIPYPELTPILMSVSLNTYYLGIKIPVLSNTDTTNNASIFLDFKVNINRFSTNRTRTIYHINGLYRNYEVSNDSSAPRHGWDTNYETRVWTEGPDINNLNVYFYDLYYLYNSSNTTDSNYCYVYIGNPNEKTPWGYLHAYISDVVCGGWGTANGYNNLTSGWLLFLTDTLPEGISPIQTKTPQGFSLTINEKTKLAGIEEYANNYSLPLASSTTRGGVKIGYIQTGQNYPVKLDNEKAYVEIPWTDTDEKVKQTSNSTTANYKVLFTTSASPNGTAAETYYNTNLLYNPGTNILSTGNLSLSGNLSVTGATTLSDNVTIGGSLTTNSLTVNGNSLFNNSVNFNSLPTIGNLPLLLALGLSNALHFIGITSTTMVDGRTTATVMISSTTHTPQIGDVVLYDHREYVWTSTSTNGTWEMLGSDASIMSSSGTSNNAANIGIIGISLSSDGTISATTGNLVLGLLANWTDGTTNGPILSVTVNGVNATATIPAASDTQSGVITTSSLTFKGIKTFYNETTTNDDSYTGILFTIKDSTIPSNKTQFASSTIRVYSDHRQEGSAGTNFVLQSGGNTIIGSGEAGLTYYNKIAKTINNDSTQNNVIGKWNNTSENFYLLADTSLYLEANNNIPSGETNPINRAGIMITTDGNIIPVAQELNNPGVLSLGNTEAAWKNLYLTNSIVSTTKNLSITLNSNTTKIWIYDNTTTTTYNGRNITPSLYVSGTGYFDGAVEASTNFINNVNTTGGGFYIKSQDIEYGRLYINTQGTTTTTGVARLILGNATTTGNIGNALGSIYLYSSSGTYVNILNSNTTTSVLVKIPNYNGHMVLAHVGNTNSAIGSSTIPVYVEGNGKISAGSTYAGGTLVTLNGGTAAAGSGVSFYAPTDFGTANIQALVGNGTGKAPKWVDISPSVSITDGNSSNTPKINITVLGRSGTALALTKASTTEYGVTKLSSATNSPATDIAATPAAVNAAYEAATSAATNSAYAGNIETTSSATYNTEPEVKSIKITDNTSANTAATNGVVLQYDTTLKVLNFVFA